VKAQEAFAVMMREQIAPALRSLGLKGSGQSYSIPSEKHWALIGFQKSGASSAAAVKFTVNLTIQSREAWAKAYEDSPWIGKKPSPNVRSGAPGGWTSRIGHLLPTPRDHWWWVEPDRPTAPVADEVVAAVRDYGLPEMRQRMANSD
jgi:Domain of unknown function (DUF4304)